MYTFKQFITEEPWPDLKPGGSMRDYANKVTPRVASGFAGALGTNRLTAALRWGKDVVAGKPGDAHSQLGSFAKERGKPDEMGFVGKPSGSTEVGPHKGAFFSRPEATKIGNKHPELKNDPTPEPDPKYPSQSYDFKSEGGKPKKKKIAEADIFGSIQRAAQKRFQTVPRGSGTIKHPFGSSGGNVPALDKRQDLEFAKMKHPDEVPPSGKFAGSGSTPMGSLKPDSFNTGLHRDILSKEFSYNSKGGRSSSNIDDTTKPTNMGSTPAYDLSTQRGGRIPGLPGTQSGEKDFSTSGGYGYSPESGGKKKKKIAEMYTFKEFLEEENKKTEKKKKPKDKLNIACKERTHGGMSYYSSWESS